MLRFNSRRIYANQTGATFRGAPSTDGGGACPAFFNTAGVNQDFSVIAWCKPTWSGSSQYTLAAMARGWALKTGSSNIVEARIAARDGTLATGGANQNTQALVVATSGTMVLNEWNLVAMSFNATSKVCRVSVFNSSNPNGSFANSAVYSVVPPTAAEGTPDGLAIGGGAGFLDLIGDLTLAMFGRQASDADLLAIYNSKQYLAPFSYMIDTYSVANYAAFGVSIPGTVTNEAGSAIASTWLVAGVSGTGTSGAAPAAPTAWPYIDSGRTLGTSYNVHRPNWINNIGVGTCTYVSHDGDAFFTRSTPPTAVTPQAVPGPSSALLAMYAGLAAAPGSHFLIVASNSRGVRRPSAGGQTVPERHSEGYMADQRSKISGVMNGRIWLSSTEATKAFGLAINQGETVESSGTLLTMQTTTGWQDFTRAWTGGDNNGAGVSQGMGLILSTGGATMGLKFTSEYGGGAIFNGDHPMHVRYHILAFPGHCGSLLYRRVKSQTQAAGTAIDGDDTTITGLDTTVATRTFNTGTDSYTAGTKTFVINTNLIAAGVQVGDLVVNTSLVSAADIASISWDGTNTTVVLNFAMGQAPANGHVLKFGPWRTQTIEADFPALDISDTEINRGLLLKAPAIFPSNTFGPVILAMDAWITDAAGIVCGHAGYSGNGYQNHLTDCWQVHNRTSGETAIHNFYRKMFDKNLARATAESFNVFLHHADQQVATPGLFNYTNAILSVAPDASVAFMGDQVHAVEADVVNWDTVVLGQSSRLAISVTKDTRLGTLNEQWAAGHRTDSAHPSALGMLRVSQANVAVGGPSARLQSRTFASEGGGSVSGLMRRGLSALLALDPEESILGLSQARAVP